MTKILSILARTKYQLIFAIAGATSYLILSYKSFIPCLSLKEGDLLVFLALIGSILALIVSISFGFLLQYMSSKNNRKHDLFNRFKSMLFEFDAFLITHSEGNPLIQACLEFSWKSKFINFDDFPLDDWENRVANITIHLDNGVGNFKEDINLENRILGYVGILEEIISSIGSVYILIEL